MPIPDLTSAGCLPPGDHKGTMEELRARFGEGPRRRMLLQQLDYVIDHLILLGVRRVWVDGSFVTAKLRPGDIDVIYEVPIGADVSKWGEFSPQRRKELKNARHVDLWPHPSMQAVRGTHGLRTQTLHDMFSLDRDGRPKGLVLMDLTDDD